MKEKRKVDLNSYLKEGVSALIGRQNGKNFFKELKGSGIDIMEDGEWLISIPDRIITINNSYFQGFFAPVFEHCGGRDKFLNKYEFHASEHIQNKVKKYVDSLALTTSPSEISGID